MHGALSHQLWKLQCRLNRRLPFSPRGRCPVGFTARGASLDITRLGPTARSLRPRVAVVITTHARPGPCRALLEGLHASLARAGLSDDAFVLVLEDRSEHDYGPALELLAERFSRRFAWYQSDAWLGKRRRYHAYQFAFDQLRGLEPSSVIFLEDDVVLAPDFVRDALARYRAIDDPGKAVLYLCKFEDDEPRGRWVHFERRPGPVPSVAQTQWFDLHAFIVERRFFELLDWRLFEPYPSRWKRDPTKSSGVSEQFTRRLAPRAHIYQVTESLAFHGALPSILNVEARGARPLNNHGLASVSLSASAGEH